MPPVRRTQEERSTATKARLLDATLACLIDLGYARTTTTEVCDRAGVSRGAQLHHYPTRAQLVSAAVEHLFEIRYAAFQRAFAAVPPGADRSAAAVDELWRSISGPTFYAWLELAVASRTDPELQQAMQAVSARIGTSIERTFRELFPRPAQPNPLFDLAPKFAFALLHGMALEQLVMKDDGRWGAILEALKALAPLAIPAEVKP
jgi:AcrR family transcriptional regulator